MDALLLVGAALGGIILAKKRRAPVSGGETLSGGGGRPWDAEPSPEIATIIESVARSYSIPVAFAFANAAHESRFRAGVGLNTLAGGAPEGAIPERSIGLMGINVNPNTAVGRSRIARIKSLRGVSSDSEVLTALRDPTFNIGFWATYIVLPLIDKATAESLTGRDKWLQIRCWLYGTGIRLHGDSRWARITRTDFVRTLTKWEERYGNVA